MTVTHAENVFATSGKRLDRPITSAEAMAEGGLDWEVGLKPTLHGWGPKRGQKIDGDFKLYRLDTGELMTRNSFTQRMMPWQNRDAFSWFDELVGDGTAIYDTVVSTLGGRRMGLFVDLQREWEPVPGDPVKDFIFLHHSHDGRFAISVGHTPMRIACANALNAALGSAKSRSLRVSVRHTAAAERQLAMAMAEFRQRIDFFGDWQQEIGALVAQKFTEAEAVQFAIDVVQTAAVTTQGKERKTTLEDLSARSQLPAAEKIIELVHSGAGTDIKGVQGTGWGMYNAVTEYVDHYTTPPSGRVNFAIFQGGARLKEAARALAARELVLG